MNNNETYVPQPLAKEAGKAFVIGAASALGTFGGMALVGWCVGTWLDRKDRKNQKSPTNET